MRPLRIKLRNVVEQLSAEGFLPLGLEPMAAGPTGAATVETSTPWYLQVFIAIAAWLAALFLLLAVAAFLFLTNLADIGDFTLTYIVIGALLCAAAIGLKRASRSSVFAGQLALALSIAGHCLLIFGMQGINEVKLRTVSAASTSLALGIVMFVIYPDRLHRFLSALLIPASILVILFDLRLQEASHILILPLAIGVVFFWENEAYFTAQNRDDIFRPLGYALPVSLLGILCLSISSWYGKWEISTWWISTLALLMVLLGLAYRLSGVHNLRSNRVLVAGVLAGAGLIALSSHQTPGILGAMLVLMIGFRRGNRGLMGLASVFLAVFIIALYYNLNISLLYKSLILVGTGLACFVMRFFLVRTWKVEEAT